MTWLAALPWVDKWAALIAADRKAGRACKLAMAAKAGAE